MLNIFLETLLVEDGMSNNTISSYRIDIEDYNRFLDVDIITSTEKDIKNYLKFLYNKKLSKKTIARKISALKKFYEFLLEYGKINCNPLHNIAMPKIGKSLPKVLTKDEIKKLMNQAYSSTTKENIRLICLLEMLYSTGMRVSELLSITLVNIKSVLKSDETPASMIISGKGKKERLVFINDTTITAIKNYLIIRERFISNNDIQHNKWLFPSHSTQRHLTRQRLHQILKDLASQSGITQSKVSPHIIRHAFASHILNNGADLISLQKLLGHQDVATTEIYTHIMNDQIEKQVVQNHPLSKYQKPNKHLA